MRRLIFAFAIVFTSLASMAQHTTEVWVSPDGDSNGIGTKDAPFATLKEALTHVRNLRKTTTEAELSEVHIIMRGGTYYLDRTLVLDSEDCGTASSPTIIEAAEGEEPIVSGGVKVEGWTNAGSVSGLPEVANGQVWVANTPVVGGKQTRFRQMWVGGVKMRRASSFDDYTMPQLVKVDKQAKRLTIPRPVMDLSKAKHLEMYIPQDWTVNIMRVKNITHQNAYHSILTFQDKEAEVEFKRPWPILRADYGSHSNHRFYLSNAIELLNRPQEWYNDIDEGKLYYWPRSGETQSELEAIVPHLETLVDVAGTLDQKVSHVTFKGITFEHTTWMRPEDDGHVALQAGMWLYDAYSIQTETANNVAWVGRPSAAVSVRNASNISFEDCKFRHLGSTGVDFVSGTRNTTVRGCVFSDIAGNHVCGGYFGDENFESHVAYNPTDERETCDGIYIENNLMIEPGNEDWGCHAVGIGFAANVNITHNEIVDAPYSAISVGWGWIHTSNMMHDNHIDYNHINGFAKYLRDCGALYTLSPQPRSSIRGNVIEKPGDSEVCPLMWDMKHAQFDIYTDEGTDYFTVQDNWCERASFSKNQNGSHNTWTNNGPNVSASIRSGAGLQSKYRHLLTECQTPAYAPVDSIGDLVYANRDQIDIVAQDDGFKLGSTLAVDLNNDNKRDIVFSGGESYQVQTGGVRINKGAYHFVGTQALAHTQFGNFAAGDLNGDGFIDLVQGGYDFWDAYNAVLMNDGQGGLQAQQLPRSSSASPACGIADINNDALPDYFFVGSDRKNTFYIQKPTRGEFTAETRLSLPGGFKDPNMIYADFDNSRSVDLCLLSSTSDGVYTRIHYNNGKGYFTERVVGFKEKGTRGGMAYADVNGDGWLDVAVGGTVQGEQWNTPASKGGMTISLYLNNGDGTFTLAQEFSEYMQDNVTQPIRFCDWDNDGYSDLIVGGWNISEGNIARVDVFLNDGKGHFQKTNAGLPGASELSLEVADFDGRGVNDIIITGNANGAMGFHGYTVDRRLAVLCKNKSQRVNTQPEAPTQLECEVDGNTVNLSWNEGNDAETPVASLSYNYYLRNVETGEYLTFPNSDVETGTRRVTGMGNAYLNKGWTLNRLPKGTYAWSVQTIDAGYAGSAFAPEQSFIITDDVPEDAPLMERLQEEGWVKVENLTDMNTQEHYFIMFDADEKYTVMATDAVGDKNWGNTITMTYRKDADPTIIMGGVYMLDTQLSGSTRRYLITPLRNQHRHYRTESWNHTLWQTYSDVHKAGDSYSVDGNLQLALMTITKTSTGWTMRNATSNAYIGPWENGAKEDAEFAADKAAGNMARFSIYSMPRVEYAQRYLNWQYASDSNPVDVTSLITNPSFSRYDQNRRPIGWTVTGAGIVEHQGYLPGCDYHAHMNNWKSSGNLSDQGVAQTVCNLPAGKYLLKVYSRCNGEGAYLFAGDNRQSMKHDGDADTQLSFELTETTDLSIGVMLQNYKSNDIKYDNIRLYYLGNSQPTGVAAPGMASRPSPTRIYDIAGCPLPRLKKGINIVDGTKIVVK